jgi:glycosyltransferase involved in cell wall biosynthesis
MVYLSIVVPVLNESALISELVTRIRTNAELITSDFEIIIIDDGSVDETWHEVVESGAKEKRLKGIKLARNFGHHYAITAGLHSAIGEWVVVMDGDLQDRPEVIPELHRKAQEGFDVVFVSRENRPETTTYLLLQRTYYLLLRVLSGIDFNYRFANFSIINNEVVQSFRQFSEATRFYGSTIKWLGFKQTQISAEHGTRHSGRPSYTFKKRISLAADILFSFSDRPLKFSIYSGITVSLSSLFAALWVILSSIRWGNPVQGLASVMILIGFLGGFTLIVIGINGIYLSRIFKEVKKRPLYIISDKNNFNQKTS